MLLKTLKIINTIDMSIIRTVHFKNGVYFIIDKWDSSQHNKVVKTTFLRLINILLGAKDKKNVYIDPETNSIEKNLFNFIQDNKISLQLQIVDNIDKPTKQYTHTLEVDLYNGGHCRIDGKRINKKEYLKKLNRIFFDNSENKPTFRQLIHSFVRVSMNGDNNTFLKNLDARTTKLEYRSVYNYLFNISNPKIDQKKSSLSKKLTAAKNDEKRYKKFQNINSLEELDQIISTMNKLKNLLKEKLNDIVSSEYFKNNRQKIEEVRQQYTDILSEINVLKYKLKLNDKYLNQLKSESINITNKELTKEFFDETKKLIPSINKTFDELVTFNLKLKNNKKIYLANISNNLNKKIKSLEIKQNNLLSGNKTLMSLVRDNKIEEYKNILSNIEKIEKEISEKETIKKTLTDYGKIINKLQKELNEMQKNSNENDSYKKSMNIFNSYFTKYANEINSESPLLTYIPEEKEFPIKITAIDGTSTGTRKSLISAYDIAYQMFAKKIKKSVPEFIIHDVMENIESKNLGNIIKIVNTEAHCQYIVAILEENYKLAVHSETDREKYKILELSGEEKLFKI